MQINKNPTKGLFWNRFKLIIVTQLNDSYTYYKPAKYVKSIRSEQLDKFGYKTQKYKHQNPPSKQ